MAQTVRHRIDLAGKLSELIFPIQAYTRIEIAGGEPAHPPQHILNRPDQLTRQYIAGDYHNDQQHNGYRNLANHMFVNDRRNRLVAGDNADDISLLIVPLNRNIALQHLPAVDFGFMKQVGAFKQRISRHIANIRVFSIIVGSKKQRRLLTAAPRL
ncbi:hypothetical protein D1872_258530 [compost metagenome]